MAGVFPASTPEPSLDYSKSGSVKPQKNAPRHAEHNAYGTAKTPFGGTSPKAELVAKLKAAAEAKKAGG